MDMLGENLRKRGWTLGVAESCTGGGVAKEITKAAGCSDYFVGGIVCYSNEVKIKALGVSAHTLEKHGAVSVETAIEMAVGTTMALGCDVAVSTTGVAGPGGGSEEKPVGTVAFGWVTPEGSGTVLRLFGDQNSRADIRQFAIEFAMELLLKITSE